MPYVTTRDIEVLCLQVKMADAVAVVLPPELLQPLPPIAGEKPFCALYPAGRQRGKSSSWRMVAKIRDLHFCISIGSKFFA